MATVCSWMRCSAVPVVALCGTITSAHAASPLDELAKRSTEHGEIRSVTSTTADPIGKDGLWGLDGTFVVRAGCGSSYEALTRVTEYPRHTNKVKRVKVLSEEEGSLKVEYTEGGLGFEVTTTQLWTFKPSPVPSITAEAVGEGDAPSWLEMTFHDVGHPGYCEVHIKVFADTSVVPNFVMNWMSSMAGRELAATYRDIIQGAMGPQGNQ